MKNNRVRKESFQEPSTVLSKKYLNHYRAILLPSIHHEQEIKRHHIGRIDAIFALLFFQTTNWILYRYSTASTNNVGLLRTILDGAVLLLFVALWMTSTTCSVLLYLSIHYQRYYLAGATTFAIVCAYLPWEKGIVSEYVMAFARYNTLYYKKCTYHLQTPSSLPYEHENTSASVKAKPNLYALHPHGAFCLGMSILCYSPRMTSVRFCFASGLYFSPFFRLWSRLAGKPRRADKSSMIKYMKRKENVALPPGGFEEATLTSEHHDRVYIKKRFGFVKLALQHGYDIVPVYCFGENATYYHFQGARKLRLKMNSFGISVILIFGAWFLPLLPKRTKYGLHVVCGDALQLPTIENPTRVHCSCRQSRTQLERRSRFGTISVLLPLSKSLKITSATRVGKKRTRRRS